MKPTVLKITLAALLSAVVIAWAQEPAPADGPTPEGTETKRTFGNGVLSENVAIYDVDNNGSLSVEELQVLQADRLAQNRHDTLRNRWDTNRDGRIDAREREAAMARIRQIIEERRCRRFNEADLDSDGFLILEEFLKISAVSAAELNSPGTATELFKHLDHDGDRRISKAEFLRSLHNLRTAPVDDEPTPKPRDDAETSDHPLRR